MRDRWVLLFAVFCLAQLPLYVLLGRGPLGYDTAIKEAESRFFTLTNQPSEHLGLTEALDEAEAALRRIGGLDSRTARLNLNRAMLAWSRGEIAEADSFFRLAIEQLEATHGPDAFYTAAVSLRYAEFLTVSRRYSEALPRLEAGIEPIESATGPKNAFAVRMVFHEVTALEALGQPERAVSRAKEYLPALLKKAGDLDLPYLEQVALLLERLSRNHPGFPVAPGGHGWLQALRLAHQQGSGPGGASEDK